LALPAADVRRIVALFKRAGLPTAIRLGAAQRRRLFHAMQLDKKVSGGDIQFVLARRIGEVVWGQKVPAEWIHRVLDHEGDSGARP
jgi:3-dehydroquinate synthetase